MYEPIYLTEPLLLEVSYEQRNKVQMLGAKPVYEQNQFKGWFVPTNVDVSIFNDFWTDHFRNWVHEVILKQPVEQPKAISLSMLMRQVSDAIRSISSEQWIDAEVVDIRNTKHIYLELTEHDNDGREIAKARGMIFASKKAMLDRFFNVTGMKLARGMKVRVKASPSYNELYGFSLQISDIDPKHTIGEMEAKRIQIMNTLTEQGIININRNLPAPSKYERVAVIAPEQAAGLGDFRTKADVMEKVGLCEFHYFGATFQGVKASQSVSSVIKHVSSIALQKQFDAIIIIRGGGDKAGLYALNELSIAEAVCLCPVPVISGIGHERDNTIIDELSRIRCATPSMVASAIIDLIQNQVMGARNHMQRIKELAKNATVIARQDIERAKNNLKEETQELANFFRRKAEMDLQTLINSGQNSVVRAKAIIDHNLISMTSLDPRKVMKRGYAVTYKDKKVQNKAMAFCEGDEIQVSFVDGSVKATVINVNQFLDKE